MKVKTILVPLTMPLVLAACLGGGGGSGGSNERVLFESGAALDYAAAVGDDTGNIDTGTPVISKVDAEAVFRFGKNRKTIRSVNLTVKDEDDELFQRDFDGKTGVEVGAVEVAGRFFALENVALDLDGNPRLDTDNEPIVNDRLYVVDRRNDNFGANRDEQLEYMTFGLWEIGLADKNVNIGGAAFGDLSPVTDTGSMPDTGTATYRGDLIGYNILTSGATTVYVADSFLEANFAAPSPSVTFSSSGTRNLATGVEDPGFNLVETTGAINGNTFSGSGLTIADLAGQAGNEDSGSFGGAFFGPEAAEAGGWFEMRNLGNSDRYFGSFGGQRGAIDVPEP